MNMISKRRIHQLHEVPHCYRVWFRFTTEQVWAERAILVDATSEDEAMMMVERSYAGEHDVILLKAEDLDGETTHQ
jgi:hypothetical protein